jgi:organic hydroperoxide reductase OsmC/OhrA
MRAALEKSDAIVVLGCGGAVQTVRQATEENGLALPVISTLNSIGHMDTVIPDALWMERCSECGDCVLNETGGICPVTLCAKGLRNGPCGGTRADGTCEADPEKDCAWELIYERLKAMGRLDKMRAIRPPHDWSKTARPRKIVYHSEATQGNDQATNAPPRKPKSPVATFETTVVWERGKEGTVQARNHPALPVAAPPEFGGPEGMWCPEELLVASVAGCLMSTFLYFAERFDVPIKTYSSTSQGTISKTADGLRFTGVEVAIRATVGDEAAREKAAALRLQEKLEKYCPVSAALNCPVRLELTITAAEGNLNQQAEQDRG